MNDPARPGVGFLTSFAQQDLFDARGRWTRRVVLLTVLLLTALGLGSLAWPGVAERSRLRKMEEDNPANLMWVWSAREVDGIDPRVVPLFEQALAEKLGPEFVGLFPFYESEIVPAFWNADPAAPASYAGSARGRTVASLADPRLKNLPLLWGRSFDREGEAGLIVTPKFLRDFGYPEDREPPPSIRLQSRRTPVPILGVTRANLPQGDRYLILQSFDDELRLGEFEESRPGVITSGLVDRAWEDAYFGRPGLPQSGVAFFDAKEIYAAFKDEAHRFELTSRAANKPTVAAWRNHLAEFAAWSRKEKLPPMGRFTESADLIAPETRPPLPRSKYTRLALQLRDLPAQELALPVIDGLGLQTSETAVEQLRAYREATQAARRMLMYILYFVLALVAINLAVIQTLRLQQKAPEIGLLRALGTRRRQLHAVFALQAGLVWIVGAGCGVGLTALVAAAYGSSEAAAVLDRGWQLRAAAFLGAVLLTLLATAGLASWLVGRGSPADRLSGGN